MVNQTFAQRLEKYQQFYVEEFLCNKDRHERLVNNPPKTDAVILTCSDSRVVPSLTFLSEPGDEFVDQSIGNVFTENTAIAIRTGILVRDVDLIMVMGHSDCLAMRSCLTPQTTDPILGIHDWVEDHCFRARKTAQTIEHTKRHYKRSLKKVTQQNIIDQAYQARDCVIQLSISAKKPNLVEETLIVGLYYDLQTGALLVCQDWMNAKPKWLPALSP